MKNPFVLFVFLVVFSTSAFSQSLLIWSSPSPGISTPKCSTQPVDVLAKTSLKYAADSKVQNFIFAEGFLTLKSSKNYSSVAGDQYFSAYYALYVTTAQLITEFDNFFNPKNFINDDAGKKLHYQLLLQDYWTVLLSKYRNPALAIIGNPTRELMPIQSDMYSARDHSTPLTPGPGIHLFLEKYFAASLSERPNMKEDLNRVLEPYLAFSKEVAKSFFNNLDQNRATYDMTLSNIRLLDFIQPAHLFTKNYFLIGQRPQPNDKVDRDTQQILRNEEQRVAFLNLWRNNFVINNVVSILKQNPKANVLLLVGDDQIRYLGKMASQYDSKFLSDENKKKIKLLPGTCDLSAALNAVKTGTDAIKLSDWQNSKYGMK